MKRFLKTHFNRFLPAAVRSAIKERLGARFVDPVTSNIEVVPTPVALNCRIDHDVSFLAPFNCKDELASLTRTAQGRAEFDSVARAARTGGVLFDIGAHSGLISALFCAANSSNRVFSFEPSPLLTERLVAIRDLNQFGERMRIEQYGIGEKDAVVEMALDPIGGFVQAQHFDHSMWGAPQPVRVKLESIAQAAERLHSIPEFLKIDIEGYEFEAIKGSQEFIARHKPTIFLELHLNYLDERQLSARSIVTMLLEAGYSFYTSGGTKLKPSEVHDSPLPIIRIIAR
jgi:FkbM family methyltransferase